MKILALVTALSISSFVLAHPEHDPPTDHPDHPSTGGKVDNAETVAKATDILTNVHNAYKNADAIQETITLTVPGRELITIKTTVDSDSGMFIVQGMTTASWVNDKLYLTVAEVEDGYVERANVKVFGEALVEISDGEMLPGFWTLLFRESDDLNDWLSTFSMGMPGTQVLGLTSETQDDGTEVDVVKLRTRMARESGWLSVNVSVTKESFINSVVMTMVQPSGLSMEISAVSEFSFAEKIPEVSFDVSGLKKYDSVDDMYGSMSGGMDDEEKSLVGKPAPDFTLSTLDGSEDVTLSSLKGNVVVLDFWATWCRPCLQGMPFLNEFTIWAQEQGLPVKVFALNVEGGSNESARKKIAKYWSGKDFKMTVLLGSEDKKLSNDYQIGGIPVTYIIAADGTIFEHHIGYDDGMLESLKKSVTKVLSGSTSKPDHPGSDHPSSDHPSSDHPG